jgi:enterobacteria phage integrase
MARIKLRYVHGYVDRHGKARFYFRRKGARRIVLPGLPGSDEFMATYQNCLDAKSKPAPALARKIEGSFGRLVTEFYASKAFNHNLKASSQRNYRGVLESLVKNHGHRAVSMMTPEAVERIINRIGAEKPAMANLTRAVLRQLMKFAVKEKMTTLNPVLGVEAFEVGEHHCWNDAELRQFERHWKIGTRERLAYALLLYTAQRVGDVASRTRSHVQDGEIYVVQEKTGAELWIPIHPELATALKGYPANGLALVGKANGQPLTTQGLSLLMSRAIDDAGLPGRCVPHGLRKALMRIMAESGATAKEIAGISGHKTLRQIEHYTKAADQRILARAAMDKVRTNSG